MVEGSGEPGAEIVVSLGDQSQTVVVGDDGTWSVEFSDVEPGDYTVVATDGETEDSVSFSVVPVTAPDPEPSDDVEITKPGDGDNVDPGEIVVEGNGPPNTEIEVTVGDETKTVVTDSDGKWSVVFEDVPAGTITITATDGTTTDSITITVGDALTRTGSEPVPAVAIAVVLLLLGALLVTVRRRRNA